MGVDDHEVYENDGIRYVEFVATGEVVDVTYFAEAPEGADRTGQYTFGSIEVAPTSDAAWQPANGTSDSVVLVGHSTNIEAAGRTTAGVPVATDKTGTGSLTDVLYKDVGFSSGALGAPEDADGSDATSATDATNGPGDHL